jgi:hypothetical protein
LRCAWPLTPPQGFDKKESLAHEGSGEAGLRGAMEKFMKIAFIAAIIVTLCAFGSASAQDTMTREQTYEEIARVLGQIEAKQRMGMRPTGPAADLYARILRETIELVEGLRVRLASNPYVRMKGFSVGLPAGLSVDFEFKD